MTRIPEPSLAFNGKGKPLAVRFLQDLRAATEPPIEWAIEHLRESGIGRDPRLRVADLAIGLRRQIDALRSELESRQ